MQKYLSAIEGALESAGSQQMLALTQKIFSGRRKNIH